MLLRCALWFVLLLLALHQGLTRLSRSPRPPRPPLQGYLSSRGYLVAARELVSELPPHFIPEEHRHLTDAPPICPTQAKAAPQAAPAQGDQLKLPLSSAYCYCTGKTQLNVISFAQNLSLILNPSFQLSSNQQKTKTKQLQRMCSRRRWAKDDRLYGAHRSIYCSNEGGRRSRPKPYD